MVQYLKKSQLELESFVQLGKILLSFFIILVFLNLFSSSLEKTITAERVQTILREVSVTPGLHMTYSLPKGNCNLKITRDEIIFDKGDESFWKAVASGSFVASGAYFIGLSLPFVISAGSAASWISYMHSKEILINPAGKVMDKEYIFSCEKEKRKKIEFYNEDGIIHIREVP